MEIRTTSKSYFVPVIAAAVIFDIVYLFSSGDITISKVVGLLSLNAIFFLGNLLLKRVSAVGFKDNLMIITRSNTFNIESKKEFSIDKLSFRKRQEAISKGITTYTVLRIFEQGGNCIVKIVADHDGWDEYLVSQVENELNQRNVRREKG